MFAKTAYLVDEFYPEFDDYITSRRNNRDIICVPMNGKRHGKTKYAWSTDGFARTSQSLWLTLQRSLQSRRLASQGASRQINLLKFNEKLAKSFARSLTYDVTHIVVMQHLLPYLWRGGHLGGRTFDVLMTSLPMANLQEMLDYAFRLHPDSRTLADFRADSDLTDAESDALKNATRIITPHTGIARLFREKAVLLDWKIPRRKLVKPGNRSGIPKIAFPASTVGRKGAFELREALVGLPVELVTVGLTLEGADFWNGLPLTKATSKSACLNDVDVVVLPAFIEHNPRILLEAISLGIPVIASSACGLANIKGVISIRIGDVKELRAEIEKAILGVGFRSKSKILWAS